MLHITLKKTRANGLYEGGGKVFFIERRKIARLNCRMKISVGIKAFSVHGWTARDSCAYRVN